MPQTPATPRKASSAAWSLEVVRGRDVGTVFALQGTEIVLGNGLGGVHGIDLSGQEGGSPRRMAARQAVLELRGGDLLIRDNDSPGGTFVNRQRLLGAQGRRLQPGDEIQLGGVQLRVVSSQGPPPSPQPAPPPPTVGRPTYPTAGGRLPEPFSIAGSVACRTWDDFLIVSAQRWEDLRGELTSGRIAEYLRRIQRTDLLPQVDGTTSADEQLDRWLGRLPVTRSNAPELDVHPERLEIRPTGGTTRHVLRVTNVGYRLLRCTARVEPPDARWVRLPPPFDGREFLTIDETEVSIDVEVPEGQGALPTARIVLESNGGTRRVGVSVGSPQGPPVVLDAFTRSPGPAGADPFRSLAGAIARAPAPARIAAGVAGALAIRTLVFAASLLPILGSAGGPSLPALAVLGAAMGAPAGLLMGWRRSRNPVDAALAGIAAGLAGVLAAAVIHAVVRTIEGPLGAWSSPLVMGLLWAALGAAIAGSTLLILPNRAPSGEASK